MLTKSMKIGMVGLGKLGLPTILAIENKGYEVCGTDVNPAVEKYIRQRRIPYQEIGTPELLEKTNIKYFNTYREVVENSDIIFVAVQTPHYALFEGITPLPRDRTDFNYTYLVDAVKEVVLACELANKDVILSIISTVLPGTVEREIKPVLSKHIKLIYNPFFIAMGTTRADFENPEFVLLGVDDEEARKTMVEFYSTIHSKPVFETSIKNAELIKVIYNTFISTKISFINTVAELCEKTGCNVDEVSRALFLGNDRIISRKYLLGGMGDGGGCHPRDNIALSWLAKVVGLSYDYFEHIMLSRQSHAKWLGSLIRDNSLSYGLPVVIMGVSFKKNINLTVGSPVLLVTHYLDKNNVEYDVYDPVVYDMDPIVKKAVYFIGMNHDDFKDFVFPTGSVVLDPWGIIKPQEGVKLISIGRHD